jgi:hypothetical protein
VGGIRGAPSWPQSSALTSDLAASDLLNQLGWACALTDHATIQVGEHEVELDFVQSGASVVWAVTRPWDGDWGTADRGPDPDAATRHHSITLSKVSFEACTRVPKDLIAGSAQKVPCY